MIGITGKGAHGGGFSGDGVCCNSMSCSETGGKSFLHGEAADQRWMLTRVVMAALGEVEHLLALQQGEGVSTLEETSLMITWGLSLTLIDQVVAVRLFPIKRGMS